MDRLSELATGFAAPRQNGDGQASRPPVHRPTRTLRWMVENTAGIAAALLVAGYGLSKPAYDAFYAALGLTPDDVGQNQVTMLMRGAVNLAIEVGSLAGLAALYLLVRHVVAGRFHRSRRAVGFVAVAVVLPVAGMGMYFVPARQRQGALVMALIVMTLATPLVLLLRRSHNGGVLPRALILVCTLAITLYAFQFYLTAAREQGDQFLRTGRVSGVWPFALCIRASQVELIDLAGDPARVVPNQRSTSTLAARRGSTTFSSSTTAVRRWPDCRRNTTSCGSR